MNGIERLALQRKAGTRPIVEDIDLLLVHLGMENVTVMTPKVEVKLRSGEWGQIPIQLECSIIPSQYRINITFIEGYPDIIPLLFVLSEEHVSPAYNASLRGFAPCEEYAESLTEQIREFSRELVGEQHLALQIVKRAKMLILGEGGGEETKSSLSSKYLDNAVVSELVVDELESQEELQSELIVYRCRYCRTELFTSETTEVHDRLNSSQPCQNVFLSESPSWLSLESEGKILCLNEKCRAKLGSWSWSGFNCSCGTWVAPSFQFSRGKVDPSSIINMQR